MSATGAHTDASNELQHMLQDDEELLWSGTPNRRRLLVDGFKVLVPVLFVLGTIGVFVLFVAGLAIEASGGDPLSILPVVGGIALLVVLIAAGGVFWVANRRYDHAEYAATDRRLISFSGAFGRDSSSVDWESIRDLEVAVGGIDGAFGTGTIYVATEGRGDIAFRYVDRPHELAAALDSVRSGDATRIELSDEWPADATSIDTPSSASASTPGAGVEIENGGAGSSVGSSTESNAGWESGKTRQEERVSPTKRVAGPGAEDVSATLEGLLRGGEELRWHYRPPKRTYLLQTMVGSLLAGLVVWSIFYGLFVGVPVLADFGPFVESLLGVSATVAVAGGWVVVQGLWLAVMAVGAWQAKDRPEFAATDQRAIKVGGFVGVDTSSIEWTHANDVEVERNLMTKLFRTGNVVVRSGGGSVRFGPVREPMTHLEQVEAIRRGEADGEPILVAGDSPTGDMTGVPSGTTSVDSLSSQARSMLRDGEALLWHGKPSVVPFVAPHLVGGLVMATVGSVAVPFVGLFGVFVVLGGLSAAGKRTLSYRNVEYVATDQRVLSFGGAVGRDSSTVDWSDIQDVEVDGGLIDGPFDTGTLRFSRAGGTTPAERADAGGDREDAFAGVQFKRVAGARRVAEALEQGRRTDEE